ncbi:MAG TPA: hypothetical protein VLL69_05660 [Streptosporangiaceae bacterium]|nr:hypothetical protein [Streptosporangiaceae bacterium]
MTGAKTIGNRQLADRARGLAGQVVIRVYPLTESAGEHLIRRSMQPVQPVHWNPEPQVRVWRSSSLSVPVPCCPVSL